MTSSDEALRSVRNKLRSRCTQLRGRDPMVSIPIRGVAARNIPCHVRRSKFRPHETMLERLTMSFGYDKDQRHRDICELSFATHLTTKHLARDAQTAARFSDAQ